MGYEEQILSWLIDSHEKKDPGNSNTRKASISITAKFPEYKEPLSDTHNDIETAIQHLLRGFYWLGIQPAMPVVVPRKNRFKHRAKRATNKQPNKLV